MHNFSDKKNHQKNTKHLIRVKALSHGDAYAQQNIIANLFAQHVSEVVQNAQRVDGRVICRVIIQ